jgi:hypothetical protein
MYYFYLNFNSVILLVSLESNLLPKSNIPNIYTIRLETLSKIIKLLVN